MMRRLLLALALLAAFASPAAAQSWIYSAAAERAIESLLLYPGSCCVITTIYGVGGSPTWTWPTVDGGAGTVLTTNGSGVLSFSSAAGVTGSGTSGKLTRWTGTNTVGAATVAESSGALSAITTLSMSGQFTSTLATGTAPFVVASTTNVANLNASSLSGATFAAPGAIGGTTPAAATFTTVTANTSVTTPLINVASGDLQFTTNTTARFFIGTAAIYPNNNNAYDIGTSGLKFRDVFISRDPFFTGLTAASGTPHTVCIDATTHQVTENAALTCTVSSRRFKNSIHDQSTAWPLLSMLTPREFKMNDSPAWRVGFIAEEVEQVDPRLVAYDQQGRPHSVRYEDITSILTKGMQELDARVRALEAMR